MKVLREKQFCSRDDTCVIAEEQSSKGGDRCNQNGRAFGIGRRCGFKAIGWLCHNAPPSSLLTALTAVLKKSAGVVSRLRHLFALRCIEIRGIMTASTDDSEKHPAYCPHRSDRLSCDSKRCPCYHINNFTSTRPLRGNGTKKHVKLRYGFSG
jgi:hypothetical protein